MAIKKRVLVLADPDRTDIEVASSDVIGDLGYTPGMQISIPIEFYNQTSFTLSNVPDLDGMSVLFEGILMRAGKDYQIISSGNCCTLVWTRSDIQLTTDDVLIIRY